ncbi:hypothetical protein V7055_00765 [Bacillus thuringiensis]|uniref:hypothetical protein n=1 Tax=Bacillus thuringiensis TaxID=1428 RepID=UPI003000A4C5
MADKYKFFILIVTAFFSLIKDFRNTSKSFFWGSFIILTSFMILLIHALDLTQILFYPKQIALEFITIPRKLFLPSVTEAASLPPTLR